mmetsp:Transcript_25901/g.36439  ORF Transcript_25901/g.36439 Transcript_25901/m.36439 type:complete len:781 (+) Transcript_25901:140-2482(+)
METPQFPPSKTHHRHGVYKKKLMFGIPIMIVGVIVIVGALVSGLYGKQLVLDRIQEQLVIDEDDPENNEYYTDWLSNTDEKDAPMYKKLTMFNLTNYEDVLATGAKPVYEAVGPYVYREYKTKLNVTFSEDHKYVNYTLYIRHFFDSVQTDSSLDPYSDVIYNINQVYMGILTKVGGEKQLLVTVSSGVVTQIMATLFGPNGGYNSAAMDAFLPYIFNSSAVSLVNEIQTTDGVSTDEAWNTFCSIWANATTDPTAYPSFNSSMRLSVNGVPSGISLESCRTLWDPLNDISLINPGSFGVTVWFGAEMANADALFLLTLAFSLTESQVNSIIGWRQRYKPVSASAVAELAGVDSVNYLGFAQWGMGNITAPIKDMLTTLPFQVSPEFAVWADQTTAFPGYRFTVDQTKRMFEGTYSMTNNTNYFMFLQLYTANNTAAIYNLWGLSYADATALYAYYTQLIINMYAQTTLQTTFAAGGGYIANRTVDTWLWNPEDPLFTLVQPGQTPPPLAQNDTSEAWVVQNKVPNTYHTGHDDIDKINKMELYEGLDQIDGVWANPEKVAGTDGTQFKPFVDTGDTLEVWPTELLRSLNFKYEKTVTNYDITLYRFTMADKEFEIDPDYFQTVDGFANVTSVNNGNPIFLSMPNMYGVDPDYRNLVEGMHPKKTNDEIQLDIEPLTGKTMEGHRRFQLNLYVKDSLLDLWNTQAASDIYFPLISVDETSVLTAEQADQFKTKVYTPYLAFTISFVVGLSVGGTLLAAGAIFTAWGGYQYYKRRQYTQIY